MAWERSRYRRSLFLSTNPSTWYITWTTEKSLISADFELQHRPLQNWPKKLISPSYTLSKRNKRHFSFPFESDIWMTFCWIKCLWTCYLRKMHFLILPTVPCVDQFWFLKWKKPFFHDNSDTPPPAKTPKQSFFFFFLMRFSPSLLNQNNKNTLSLQSTYAYIICLTKTRYGISPLAMAVQAASCAAPRGLLF